MESILCILRYKISAVLTISEDADSKKPADVKKEQEGDSEEKTKVDTNATTPEIKVDEPTENETAAEATELKSEVKTGLSDSGISDNEQDGEYEFDLNRYFNTKIQLNMGRPALPEETALDDEVVKCLTL